jgi:hypothetical protein
LANLEIPPNVASLYLARGEEVDRLRPIMQGDVFAGVDIPGTEFGLGLAAVLTHPCTMRGAGGLLRPKLSMARVVPYQALPLHRWPSGHYGMLPLPELRQVVGENLAIDFEEAGTMRSTAIALDSRVAYLTDYGVTVLQQRFLHHHSRVVVPLPDLHSQAAPNFEEADLLHEWLEALVDDPSSTEEILRMTREFDAYLNTNGGELRNMLKSEGTRSTVRKRVRIEIRSRVAHRDVAH